MSKVRTDFSAGVRFGRLVGEAVLDGLALAAAKAQGISSIGMIQANPGGYTRKITGSKAEFPGIEYYVGKGAPIGGYPGVRTGNLERTLYSERGGIRQGRPVAYLGAGGDSAGKSVGYAAAVHKDRPFLMLPFSLNRADIMRAFVKGTRRRLA